MGEIADWMTDQAIEQGLWFRAPRLPPKKPTCNACGAKTVHWRLFDGTYKLADDQRQHPGNRYVQHVCQTSADGFGDCE